MFRRILVAYDGSAGAREALQAAVELARRNDARLVAVAVEAHLPHYAATIGKMDEERQSEERDASAG